MFEQDDYDARYDIARRFLKVFGGLQKYLATASISKTQITLTPNQLKMLHLIRHEPGITQTRLAERLGVTTAAISMAIRDLETQNLVCRQINTGDARSMLVFLAPQGQEIFEKIFSSYVKVFVDLFDELPLNDQQKMIENLEHVLATNSVYLNTDSSARGN
ncbi:MAG TPA: MarR family transcriptional regulator [Phototrophicaceae bacterium]|nr:MarR family transcriptional regulator [Phototrophicaceae bacterium]